MSKHLTVLIAALVVAVAAIALTESHDRDSRTLPLSRLASVRGDAGGKTVLLLWPAGPPEFGDLPGGGPGTTVNVDDLSTGRHVVKRIPGIAPGDFPVPVLSVGRWLVYNSNRGVAAIRDTQSGPPRVLGQATFFVPSATPDQIWLVHTKRSSGRPVSIQSASVSAGRCGRELALPPRAAGVIAGSAAGILLVARSGQLELWRPGHRPRTLAHLGGPLEGAGFASDARLVAYGSGCRIEEATSGFPRTPVGYDACRTLNVIDVATHARLAFPAPPRTAGWVPDGFGVETAIAPDDRMLAAAAVIAPARKGRTRLFVLRLAHNSKPTPVPMSIARLYARTAWSPDSAWLFYQGPNARLRALETATARTYPLAVRCCQYTAMVAIPSR